MLIGGFLMCAAHDDQFRCFHQQSSLQAGALQDLEVPNSGKLSLGTVRCAYLQLQLRSTRAWATEQHLQLSCHIASICSDY